MSLSVIAECDSTFTRDFVLLIDTLLIAEIQQTSDEDIVNSDEIADTVAAKRIDKMSRVVTSTNVKKAYVIQLD